MDRTSQAFARLVGGFADEGRLSMTGKRTPRLFVGVTWSERQIRQHSAGALRHAIRKAAATQTDAAKWCRVSERTIRAWLAERASINLPAVLRSGRLRREFLRYLRVCDRKEGA